MHPFYSHGMLVDSLRTTLVCQDRQVSACYQSSTLRDLHPSLKACVTET